MICSKSQIKFMAQGKQEVFVTPTLIQKLSVE